VRLTIWRSGVQIRWQRSLRPAKRSDRLPTAHAGDPKRPEEWSSAKLTK
jgi:hypothetical protein